VVGVSAPLIVVTRMPQSGRTVYLAEANARNLRVDFFGIHDVFDLSHLPVTPPPQRSPQTSSSRVAVDNRHGGRINLLYLDGHVESKPFKDVQRTDFDWLYYQ
jgi:prepilin-type processing-associated H-X9-DG protein